MIFDASYDDRGTPLFFLRFSSLWELKKQKNSNSGVGKKRKLLHPDDKIPWPT